MDERQTNQESVSAAPPQHHAEVFCDVHGERRFMRYLRAKKRVIVGTLGPEATSSENTQQWFCEAYLGAASVSKKLLFQTFEDALSALLDDEIDLVIIPHAYEKANVFYMNSRIDHLFIFMRPTPSYGFGFVDKLPGRADKIRLASHSAPLPMTNLLPSILGFSPELEVVVTDSTCKAAELAKDGNVDIALTNQRAAESHGLEFIGCGELPMSWSVFGKKGWDA